MINKTIENNRYYLVPFDASEITVFVASENQKNLTLTDLVSGAKLPTKILRPIKVMAKDLYGTRKEAIEAAHKAREYHAYSAEEMSKSLEKYELLEGHT